MRRSVGLLLGLGVLALGLQAGPGVVGAGASSTNHLREASSGHGSSSVVIVGMPGLRWSDVSETTTPYLWGMVPRSSVGQMSTRSARSRTCPADGWVQLGTGNRARYPIPDDPVEGSCEKYPSVVPVGRHGARVEGWSAIRDANEELLFGAVPGLLAQTLEDTGRCTTAIGDGAALSGANRTGIVDRWLREPSALDSAALRWCPLTVVANDVPETIPPGDERRAEDLAGFDSLVATVDAMRPEGSLLLVLGVSDLANERGQLHLSLANGPGFDDGYLISGSTRRAPFVQLSDMAPTALRALGVAVPPEMPYQPIRSVGTADQDRYGWMLDLSEQANVQGQLTSAFFSALVVSQALLYLAAYLLLRRHPRDRTRSRVLDFTYFVAIAAAAGPAATYLANLLPWWQSTHPVVALLGAISLAGLTLTLFAFAGPWRRHPFGPAGAVAGATAVVLAVDVAAGAPLQLASVAGYSPVVAGRFVGFGNLAFAIFGTAALLATAAVISGRSRRVSLAIVSAVGLTVIIWDGMPFLGSDFGGVIALVPAFGVLGWVATGRRLSWRPLAVMLVAGFAAVSIIATLDYLRPEDARTHLGRFVGSVLDGQAWVIVERKIDANVSLLTSSVLTLMVPLVIVFLVFLIRRPSGLLPWTYTKVPTLRAGLLAVLTLGVLGALVNDSGVAVPAMAASVAIPVAVAVVVRCMRLYSDGESAGEQPRVASTDGPEA